MSPPPDQDRPPGPPPHLLLAVLLVATFVVYAGTLAFDFVNDDHEQIAQNLRIQSWRFAPRYFTEQVWSQLSPHDPSNYYRPAFLLWLRANHALFGVRPWGWHLTTVLLHLGVTLLVYFLALRVLEDPFDAFISGLIFGIHPIHLESVAWVSGVTDPLLGVFFLSSFLAYGKQRASGQRRGLWATVSLAFFALALLTKETAIALPILLLGWETINGPAGRTAPTLPQHEKLRGLAVSLGPYMAISAVYLLLRREVLGEFSHTFTSLPLRTVFLTAPSLLGFYARHLAWPAGLSNFYDLPYVTGLSSVRFILPVAALLALGAAVAWWAKSFLQPTERRAVAFASLWMLVPLLPVLNPRVFPESDIVHDRYLYLPSVGFAILVAVAIHKFGRGSAAWRGYPKPQVVATALLALGLGFGTVSQSLMWADDLLLAYRGVQVAPRSYYAVNILANALAEHGNREDAIGLYQKVFELNPNYWVAHYNLALVYFKAGRLPEAEQQVHWAIQLNSRDSRQYVLLGLARFQGGHADDAADLMRRAIELRPDLANPHMGLGMILETQGKLEAALQEFKTAFALDPRRTTAQAKAAELARRLEKGPSGTAPEPVNPSLEAPSPVR